MATRGPTPESRDDWIDTTELRAKKRKRRERPISKLLNPLARNGGYNVAVALNFTQTKLPMPPTKQSNISSFFKPQQKAKAPLDSVDKPVVISKSKTPPAAEFDCKAPLGITNVLPGCETLVVRGSKGCGDKSEKGHGALSPSNEKFLHLIYGNASDEEDKLLIKRDIHKPFSCPVSGSRQTIPNQDLQTKPCLFVPESTQVNDLENTLSFPNNSSQAVSGHDGVHSISEATELDFMAMVDLAGRTSTQKSHCALVKSPTKHSGKENCPLNTARSQYLGWKRSPLKACTMSPSNRARPHVTASPKKLFTNKVALTESQPDSIGALFTQDSQGLWVIAHRNRRPLSPLKDRTSPLAFEEWEAPGVTVTGENSEPDVEEEMLFTQDSQGNLVIKH